MTGGGIGTMIVPVLCNFVTINFGCQGYFIAISLLSCLNLVFVFSASPVEKEQDEEKDKNIQTYRTIDPDLLVEQTGHMTVTLPQSQLQMNSISNDTEPQRALDRSSNALNQEDNSETSQNRRGSIAINIQRRMSHGPNLAHHVEMLRNRRASVAIDAHISMMKVTKEDSQKRSNKFCALWLLFKDSRMFWYCIVNGCFTLAFGITFVYVFARNDDS